MIRDRVILLLEGLTDLEGAKSVFMDDGSKNFLPTEDGYIANYPGRLDYFLRSSPPQEGEDAWGAAPNTGEYTRIYSFVDYLGVNHLVVVRGSQLLEIQGNGYSILYTFQGRNYNGKYFPSFFVHNSKLIIVNEDDFPLLWDGVDGIELLGVQEIPNPPNNVECMDADRAAGFDEYTSKNCNILFDYGNGIIDLGPSLRKNTGGSGIEGWYRSVVQFVDRYGNKGKASAPSSIHPVASSSARASAFVSMQIEWVPPRSDWHIHSVIVGRTLTLNPDDSAPLGNNSTFYKEVEYEGTTITRRTARWTDEGLATLGLVDTTVRGPPSFVAGCSFGGRVWGVTEDGIVYYSDLVYFGQFRETQIIRPISTFTAIVPAGDRIFIIGDTSTEVFYESANGPALLEQDIANGSRYGNTFVAVGDGVVFGLWNNGFGYYDGKEHKYVGEPEYIRGMYLDVVNTSHSGKLFGDWYVLAIRRNSASEKNNVLLWYNLKTNRWYIVEDVFYDLCEWDGEKLGVDDSIYVIGRGSSFPQARLKTAGIVNAELHTASNLTDVRMLVDPGGNSTVDVTVEAETSEESSTGTNQKMYPHDGASKRSARVNAYWSRPNTSYPVDWISPSDVWITFDLSSGVSGHYHKLDFVFDSGFPVRIKAIQIGIGRPKITDHK